MIKRQKKKKKKGGRNSSSHSDTDADAEEIEDSVVLAAKHGVAIVRNLSTKLRSLESGISALETCTDGCVCALEQFRAMWKAAPSKTSASVVKAILEHWFGQYLRLRDGFVFLHNGECRHRADKQAARKLANRKSPFRSRFGANATRRSDGYTTLYSSKEGYSGLSYDEFFDEKVGVKTRLLQSLERLGLDETASPLERRRDAIWNHLLDDGAQAIDFRMDQIDRELSNLQRSLERARENFAKRVVQSLRDWSFCQGVVLEVQPKDACESLHLKNAQPWGISELILERPGTFCLNDEGGVLPSEWSRRHDWETAMRIPTDIIPREKSTASGKAGTNERPDLDPKKVNNVKKRRIIIADDDEEENEKEEQEEEWTEPVEEKEKVEAKDSAKTSRAAPQTSNSMEFKVRKLRVAEDPRKRPAEEDEQVRINDIKRQCGVDADTLEHAREEMEKEKRRSAAVASAVDALGEESGSLGDEAMDSADVVELLEEISNGHDEVSQYRDCVTRATDADERWNARDQLRQALMTLGSAMLELNSAVQGKGSGQRAAEAQTMFREALDIAVKMQVDEDSPQSQRSCESDKAAICRHLLIVKGRAQANIGVSQMEEVCAKGWGSTARAGQSRCYLKQAIGFLENAKKSAKALQSHVCLMSKVEDGTVLARDKLCARGLETFCGRWHGTALWLLQEESAAEEVWRSAAECNGQEDTAASACPGIVEDQMTLLLEQYAAAQAMMDAGTQKLEDAVAGRLSPCQGDKVLSGLVHRGFAAAIHLVERIKEIAKEGWEQVQTMHGIPSAAELSQEQEAVRRWWHELKTTTTARKDEAAKLSVVRQQQHRIRRGDVPFHTQTRPARTTLRPTQQSTSSNNNNNNNKTKMASRLGRGVGWEAQDAEMETGAAETLFSPEEPAAIRAQGVPPVQYRKWGDELLGTNAGGLFQPEYPAIAPEKPLSWEPRQ